MLVMDSGPHFVPAQQRHRSNTLDPVRGVVPTRSAEASRYVIHQAML